MTPPAPTPTSSGWAPTPTTCSCSPACCVTELTAGEQRVDAPRCVAEGVGNRLLVADQAGGPGVVDDLPGIVVLGHEDRLRARVLVLHRVTECPHVLVGDLRVRLLHHVHEAILLGDARVLRPAEPGLDVG